MTMLNILWLWVINLFHRDAEKSVDFWTRRRVAARGRIAERLAGLRARL
jgi:hypothetical protein